MTPQELSPMITDIVVWAIIANAVITVAPLVLAALLIWFAFSSGSDT